MAEHYPRVEQKHTVKYQRHPSSGFGGVSDYYRNRLTLI
jgi:hypothetical protein